MKLLMAVASLIAGCTLCAAQNSNAVPNQAPSTAPPPTYVIPNLLPPPTTSQEAIQRIQNNSKAPLANPPCAVQQPMGAKVYNADGTTTLFPQPWSPATKATLLALPPCFNVYGRARNF